MNRLGSGFVLGFLLLSTNIHVQTTSSAGALTAPAVRITGVVLDSSGGVIPGAEVTITNATGGRTVLATDAAGRFATAPSGSGPFTVVVVAHGFAPAIEADAQPSVPLTVRVTPAGVEEHVDVVSATRPATVASTATRTSTPLLHIPQAIDVVAAPVLQEQAVTSLGDALRNVPGVNTSLGEGRRDQFLIRGFSAQNDTLLDGTRDDAPYYRDVSTVERIEVVKGPAAALFGRGSSGGVINRVLKAPVPNAPIAEG